jgi:hypothetical protein
VALVVVILSPLALAAAGFDLLLFPFFALPDQWLGPRWDLPPPMGSARGKHLEWPLLAIGGLAVVPVEAKFCVLKRLRRRGPGERILGQKVADEGLHTDTHAGKARIVECHLASHGLANGVLDVHPLEGRDGAEGCE